MKNITKSILLAGFSAFLITACSLPIHEFRGTTGAIAINVNSSNETALSVRHTRNVSSWPDTAYRYEATGSGPAGKMFINGWENGETNLVESLDAGPWMITVTSFDNDHRPIGRGTKTVTVNSGETVAVNVILGFIAGTGSVSFSVRWPDASNIHSGTATVNGTMMPLSIDSITETTGSCSFVNVAAGTGHEYGIVLFTELSEIAYSMNGTIHVTNGIDTPVLIDISEVSNPPTMPSNLSAVNGRFCVNLAWNDTQGETAFWIERSITGADSWVSVADLPKDTTEYRDIAVSPETTYDYRVIAYNETNEARSEKITIMTPVFSDAIIRTPVAFGGQNGYRILVDGTVMAYGSNRDGQLGRSSEVLCPEGTIIPGLSDILSIKSSSGLYSSLLALDSSGNVWRWGYLNAGNDYVPQKVPGLTRQIIDISVGDNFFFALDADGRVWTWGSNSFGQLGNGSMTNVTHPAIITGLPEIREVVAGARHGLALTTEGTVFVWGENLKGQLGLGTTVSQLTPIQVPSLSGVNAIRASNYVNAWNSFVIMNDGSVRAAGYNVQYLLGLSEQYTNYTLFTNVPGLTDIVDLADTLTATIALDSDGNMFGSGSNFYGALLSLPQNSSSFTNLTTAPASIRRIFAGSSKVCVIDNLGKAYSWGDNTYGALMNGEACIHPMPSILVPSVPFSSIIGGSDHYLAIDTSGDVWAWGSNSYGQIGDGTAIVRPAPVKVLATASPAIQVSAYGSRSAVLLQDGSIYIWGSSASGSIPDQFTDVNLGSDVVEISIGGQFCLARKANGSVWSWGSNYNGQLGNNTYVNSSVAVQVVGIDGSTPLSGVTKIVAQNSFSTALLETGAIATWGYGYPTNWSSLNVPVLATGITAATAFYSGAKGLLAVQDVEADGVQDLWLWGSFYSTNYSSPSKYTPNLTGIQQMYFTDQPYSTSIALLTNGSIRIRGSNSSGLAGNGAVENINNWDDTSGLTDISSIAMTETSCAAITNTGVLRTWGLNNMGQIANGSITPQYNTAPIELSW